MIAVDLFAGAGGSTVGAEQAGARVVLAANHWRAAIDVHRANHPDAEHWLSVAEQLAISGFPSTYRMPADRRLSTHLIGNAVCPPVMEAIVRQISRRA